MTKPSMTLSEALAVRIFADDNAVKSVNEDGNIITIVDPYSFYRDIADKTIHTAAYKFIKRFEQADKE